MQSLHYNDSKHNYDKPKDAYLLIWNWWRNKKWIEKITWKVNVYDRNFGISFIWWLTCIHKWDGANYLKRLYQICISWLAVWSYTLKIIKNWHWKTIMLRHISKWLAQHYPWSHNSSVQRTRNYGTKIFNCSVNKLVLKFWKHKKNSTYIHMQVK